MSTHITHSPEETRKLGEKIGGGLKRGDFVSISGDLGSGKTCLVQGIAIGMGVSKKEYVRSPTFTILFTYQGRFSLHHFDFYRISKAEEIEELGLDEYFQSDGICVVEWPERLGSLTPKTRLEILIEDIQENKRRITVTRVATDN